MNSPEKLEEDILSRYISPEKIEKAPEGFTQRTMIRLQSEKAPVVIGEMSVKGYEIPLISVAITLALIITAVLLSTSNDYTLDLSVLKSISKISIREFSFDKLFSFTLPELLIYISIGVFLLLLFDQVLNRFFHRERK